ncbi:MAG TPA: glycosyltransferase family 4 protein, partial [Nitrososphaerales archaeon]|nr:glycosyltransferase family 4 protein [Nitrososphaerales archaeon]
RGLAYQTYPYIDGKRWKKPSRSVEDAFRERVRLKRDENLLLVVARMDPVKSQDVAIRALARIKSPGNYKLLMIGNGSFSSSKSGGLGRDKGAVWKQHLREEARALGMEDRVEFMGYATDEELRAAYRLASAVILPSRIEGFGIAVLEGWMNGKPVVVSRGAGASELVEEGVNGYTFEPGDDMTLAEGIRKATGPSAERLGANGTQTVKQCLVGEASKQVRAVLEDTVASF